MLKWKLFCTVTMETYFIEAESSLEAKKKLAMDLNVPLDCVDAFADGY